MPLVEYENRAIRLSWALAVAASLPFVGCSCSDHHEEHSRHVGAAVIVMEAPAHLGNPVRPVVEFDHLSHVEAMEAEGCRPCHQFDEGQLVPRLKGVAGASDLEDYRDRYHATCIGCHEERSGESKTTGPLSCGECHVRHHGEAESERVEMRWDLSLHGRHVEAEGEQCDGCHHIYNEKAKRLEPGRGQESACRDCHGETDGEGKRYSLRNGSHRSCLGCHLERAEKGVGTGPVTCIGCHEAKAVAGIQKLVNPPRLKRGQPDNMWIHTKGASSKHVAFDHAMHEGWADSCSTCHHETLRPCGECHTVEGNRQGGGVTLEQAFHDAESERSCIGCHESHFRRDPNCVGCHSLMPPPPSDRSCDRCHTGSDVDEADPEALVKALELIWPPELPSPSHKLPDQVVIDVLADRYGPAKLPHYQVAAMYDTVVRTSKLASRFHRDTAVPCGACHHHTPPGDRPPPCRACHTEDAHPTKDVPSLRAAYHRQCMGCHEAAGLGTGCTDCHPEAEGRGQR